MPVKRGQKLKMLYLMKLFMEESDEDHPLTMAEIIRWLADRDIEAERRSVYEDIRLLQDFGVDIVGEKRKQYVYYIANRQFELAELKLLVDTVTAARFVTDSKSRQLIRKLSSLTSRHFASQLSRQVYASGRVKAFNEGIYYNVDAIHRGINENCQISFKYYDYDLSKKQVLRRQGERYQVSPYILSWDSENYYMVAFHERYDRLAHFRVDKMTDVRIEAAKRQALREDLDPGAYCQSVFGMFSGEETWVKVRFAEDLIGVVIDRFGRDVNLQSDQSGQGYEEGCAEESGKEKSSTEKGGMAIKGFTEREKCFVANLKVAVSPVFLSWLIQFGGRASILAPAVVRDQMKAMLEESLSPYIESQ
jgi:predicted DNA-binding transcriptional regulator YafY